LETIHCKNAELFQPKFGSNIDKSSNWVNILNENFNPKFRFVHILPKIGLKQPSNIQMNRKF